MKRSLRRFLRKRGASDAEIDNAVRGGYLAPLVLDREIVEGARRYTMDEISAAAGTERTAAKAVSCSARPLQRHSWATGLESCC